MTHNWAEAATVILAIVVVLGGMFAAALALGRAWRNPSLHGHTENIPPLPDEPAEMTVEKRINVCGVTMTLGDMIEHLETYSDKGETGETYRVPRARVVRVVALSGFPILKSSADSRALGAALEEFAKDQERAYR